jgi:uncharacterized membrane protein
VALIMNAMAYTLLCWLLLREAGPGSKLAIAVGGDWKSKLSLVIYVLGIGVAFVNSVLGCCIYAVVSVIWFIPDRRIEKAITEE